MSKGDGRYITIKFDKALTTDPAAIVGVLEDVNIFIGHLASEDSSGTVSGTSADAIDGSTATFWRVTNGAWWKLTLTEPAIIRGFRYYSGGLYRLRQYKFEASNDGTSWTELWSGENANSTGWRDITFENETAYLYYRWTFLTNWTGRIYLYEFEVVGDVPAGNEIAFGVSGQERAYILMPEETDGPLVSGDYVVADVEEHPTEPNAILLTMKEDKRFRNVSGDLTVDYDMTKGNLAGLGGAVVTFSESFTPADLVEEICRWWRPETEETLTLALTALAMTRTAIEHQVLGDGPFPTDDERYHGDVYYIDTPDQSEILTVSIGDLTLTLTHIDDLDP